MGSWHNEYNEVLLVAHRVWVLGIDRATVALRPRGPADHLAMNHVLRLLMRIRTHSQKGLSVLQLLCFCLHLQVWHRYIGLHTSYMYFVKWWTRLHVQCRCRPIATSEWSNTGIIWDYEYHQKIDVMTWYQSFQSYYQVSVPQVLNLPEN